MCTGVTADHSKTSQNVTMYHPKVFAYYNEQVTPPTDAWHQANRDASVDSLLMASLREYNRQNLYFNNNIRRNKMGYDLSGLDPVLRVEKEGAYETYHKYAGMDWNKRDKIFNKNEGLEDKYWDEYRARDKENPGVYISVEKEYKYEG